MDLPSPSQNQFWSLLAKKLSNEANAEELQELHSILLNNPNLHHQADMLAEMWQQSNINAPGIEAAYMRHVMKYKDEFFVKETHETTLIEESLFEENPENRRSIIKRKSFAIFSIIVFLMLATGGIYFFSKKKSTGIVASEAISSVATKNGNRTNIVLPDGSQVRLNAGSNLDYSNSHFNKDIREVTLNGEAYFDVVKNADKPFIIHTKRMDIKVLGTSFNVRSYNDEKFAEAALISGSLEVTLKDRDQKITLKPNEKISVANEEPIAEVKPEKAYVAKSNSARVPQIVVNEIKPSARYNIIGEIAWTQNKLYFEDETLEDIGHLIERWFGKKVTIANESLKSVRYTGKFENETMEDVLSYLKLSKSFNFRIGTDNVVIY